MQRFRVWQNAPLCVAADVLEHPAAAVQRCGYRRGGTVCGGQCAGGSGIEHRADQSAHKHFRGALRGQQCADGAVLRRQKV